MTLGDSASKGLMQVYDEFVEFSDYCAFLCYTCTNVAVATMANTGCKNENGGGSHRAPKPPSAGHIGRAKTFTGHWNGYVFPSARSPRRPMSDNAILSAFRNMGISNEEMTATDSGQWPVLFLMKCWVSEWS